MNKDERIGIFKDKNLRKNIFSRIAKAAVQDPNDVIKMNVTSLDVTPDETLFFQRHCKSPVPILSIQAGSLYLAWPVEASIYL